MLQAQTAAPNEEKRTNLAPTHNLERQLEVELNVSKLARGKFLVACQAFINVLRVTTPVESFPTIYRGDPSKELLRDFHITMLRNTRTDLSESRREAYQPPIDITTDPTVTGREESPSQRLLFVVSGLCTYLVCFAIMLQDVIVGEIREPFGQSYSMI